MLQVTLSTASPLLAEDKNKLGLSSRCSIGYHVSLIAFIHSLAERQHTPIDSGEHYVLLMLVDVSHPSGHYDIIHMITPPCVQSSVPPAILI